MGGKELEAYLEVRGYAQAARWVYGHGFERDEWSTEALVSAAEIRHVHALAMGPVWEVAPHPNASDREGPGSFRQHEIAAFPDGMRPPSWVQVEAEVAAWVTDLAQVPRAQTPLEALASAHGAFERIHPFIDGNGRTGRLVLNLALLRLGYPPAVIFTRDRDRYLAGLRRSDRGDSGALGELIARSVTDNVYRFIIPALTGDEELVPLVALASPALKIGAMRQAVNRGRLRAQQDEHGTWRSSKVWVREYLASKHRP